MPKQISIGDQNLMVKLMNLFWINGFMGTSIDDLVAASGFSKTFIYTKYGKKGLFEEVFYYYVEKYTDPFLKALNEDPRGIEAIQDKLSRLADSLIDHSMPKACLFVNTVVEMGNKDKDFERMNKMYINRVAKMYSKKLNYCCQIGEIKNASSIPYYTTILTNLLFSLAVLYKVKSKEELHSIIAAQLYLIR